MERAQANGGVPTFVERELRVHLSCGILANGFVRVHCDGCGHDRLVGYSCKGRGFCPSRGGQRMADTAAWLRDSVQSAWAGARERGGTSCVMDEPTTGLHRDDVARLIQVLHRLVERGDTVVVIEGHPDVMVSADRIIDLGPEHDEHGGHIVARRRGPA